MIIALQPFVHCLDVFQPSLGIEAFHSRSHRDRLDWPPEPAPAGCPCPSVQAAGAPPLCWHASGRAVDTATTGAKSNALHFLDIPRRRGGCFPTFAFAVVVALCVREPEECEDCGIDRGVSRAR